MTMPSEHRGRQLVSTVELLAISAIIISGIAATVLWFYIMW